MALNITKLIDNIITMKMLNHNPMIEKLILEKDKRVLELVKLIEENPNLYIGDHFKKVFGSEFGDFEEKIDDELAKKANQVIDEIIKEEMNPRFIVEKYDEELIITVSKILSIDSTDKKLFEVADLIYEKLFGKKAEIILD